MEDARCLVFVHSTVIWSESMSSNRRCIMEETCLRAVCHT